MKRSWALPLGLLLVLIGGIWGAQGFGWLQGSAMTDETLWAVVGPIVMVIGVAVVALGQRRKES